MLRKKLAVLLAGVVFAGLLGMMDTKVRAYETPKYDPGANPVKFESPMDVHVIEEGGVGEPLIYKPVPGYVPVAGGVKKGEEIKVNVGGSAQSFQILGANTRTKGGLRAMEYVIKLESPQSFLNNYLIDCDKIFTKGTKTDYLELTYEIPQKGTISMIYTFKNVIPFETKLSVPNSAVRLHASWYENGTDYKEASLELTPAAPAPEKPAVKNQWDYRDGSWYYFGDDGNKLVNQWIFYDNQWYYLGQEGKMQIGWFKDGNDWYYLGTSGAMMVDWQMINGSWYYLNPGRGHMAIGWQMIRGSWYYLNELNGNMEVGWKQIKGKWYYMYESGAMAANTWVGPYYVDGSGAWVK